MATFHLKPLKVEATRWWKHGDHSDVSLYGFDARGGVVEPGDWVVTTNNRSRSCSDEEFHQTFSPDNQEAAELLKTCDCPPGVVTVPLAEPVYECEHCGAKLN